MGGFDVVMSENFTELLQLLHDFRSQDISINSYGAEKLSAILFISGCLRFQCRQPEDHVFALLGSLGLRYFPFIQRHFDGIRSKSSLLDIYMTFARLCLKD